MGLEIVTLPLHLHFPDLIYSDFPLFLSSAPFLFIL